MKTQPTHDVLRAALLLSTALGLIGCAGSPVPKAKEAGITTVTVEPRVGIRRPLQYGAKSQQMGLAAALTDVIVTGIHKGKSRTVAELLQETDVDVTQIVRDRFIVELHSLEELTVVTNGGQGTFLLSLEQHGFDTPPFSSRPIPFLELRGELLDAGGRRLWRGNSGLVGMGAGPISATWEEYRANPQRLRDAWEVQATRAARMLLRTKASPRTGAGSDAASTPAKP